MTTRPVEISGRILTDSRKPPIKALAEAIWNALDAGADHVRVDFEYDRLGAIQTIVVRDDGEGMSRERAGEGFDEYGDSWKRRTDARAHNGRTVRGQRGQGRYDLLRLGSTARWDSVAEQVDGTLGAIHVELRASDPHSYEITDPSPHSGPTGTTLRIADVTAAADKDLNRSDLAGLLAADFALYLRQYPDVGIQIGDIGIDPCDASGAPILDVPDELRSGEILFAGHICWDGFKDSDTGAHPAILTGDAVGVRVYPASREAIAEQLERHALARQLQVVDDWKSEQSYPYDSEPTTPPEKVIRKAFDIVATAATPVLTRMSLEQRRFSMRMMRVAVETDPSAVQKIMREVLRLPEERVEEMAALFERTTPESIITTTHSVLNRLDFLAGLRSLVFEPRSRRATTERRQLHKILEREAWLFGDEWTLTASDETLRRVLLKHLHLLGEDVAYDDVMPRSQEGGQALVNPASRGTSGWSATTTTRTWRGSCGHRATRTAAPWYRRSSACVCGPGRRCWPTRSTGTGTSSRHWPARPTKKPGSCTSTCPSRSRPVEAFARLVPG
ncbi:ATP-binding protein [Phytohabitans suffuscus]|uniref:Histidine kinase/HSP90-like ATPase domain-containing protein n=1 Tax=Phytohabitans suffuscus TaxID=624315 RepID=A0A6F8YXY1_9ACTN|nr:ATP-binding protein [Phytohabitans suffuscus]BCB90863.1 hypothetical protein Psuf_081760 [Phytohabitans suffuscus]